MSFDLSRFTFRAWSDFLGVVMQQGRVQLDADWNELVAQLVRRVQAGSLDTYAQSGDLETGDRAVVPRATPDGFRIEAAGGGLTIGVGRIYVDGILAENHGAGALAWDPRLAEEVGSDPVSYDAQPYYPSPPALPGGGPHLVYLDVWQREVTWLQHPGLVEKAVGVDTTARLQTVWQVKVHARIGTADCATDDGAVPGWEDVIRPSAARLTTGTASVPGTPDPCLIPPAGGYKGLENQLYRVEIHDAGVAGGGGGATFKWSRDNGSVATRVVSVAPSLDRLVVDSVGRDDVLRFVDGDWVEITDDVRELGGQPGVVRRIRTPDGVSDATRTIVLASPLPAGTFPTGADDATDPERHTRIRRWNQAGRVLREDGTVFFDLDAGGSAGVVPVPPAGTRLLLEDGIVVAFDLADPAGRFHAGDHWSFAARTADASVEELDAAPPLGTHHHYARLAVVTFPDAETDCRVLWPPAAAAGGDCACDVCVTAESHAAGTLTIQQAVDQVAKTGGVVCLGAGIFRLRDPVRIADAGSVTVRGKGWRTMLVPLVQGSAITVRDSLDVALEDFAAVGAGSDDAALVAARNVTGLDLERLVLAALPGGAGAGTALSLEGVALGARVRESVLVAGAGITGGDPKGPPLLTAQLTIADNLLLCRDSGIDFGRRTLHYGDAAVARNLVLVARRSGITMLGGAMPGSAWRVDANTLFVAGDAVVAGVDGIRVADNQIRGVQARGASGIVLAPGLDPSGIAHASITGNHVASLPGAGIEVRTPLGSAIITGNVLEQVAHGIVFATARSSAHVTIGGNHLLRVGPGEGATGVPVAGIQVIAAREVDIAGNLVSAFAQEAVQAASRVAIRVAGSSDVRSGSNRLVELGPPQDYVGYVTGVDVQAPFLRATLGDNLITRSTGERLVPARWYAIRVGRPDTKNVTIMVGAILLLAGGMHYLLAADGLAAAAAVEPGPLAVRGNHGEAREIRTSLVEIDGPESCLFSDNHFEASPAAASGPALVHLRPAAAVLSSNRLRWTDPNTARPSVELTVGATFTVLGNATTKPIVVNGAPLGNPWAPLNVIG